MEHLRRAAALALSFALPLSGSSGYAQVVSVGAAAAGVPVAGAAAGSAPLGGTPAITGSLNLFSPGSALGPSQFISPRSHEAIAGVKAAPAIAAPAGALSAISAAPSAEIPAIDPVSLRARKSLDGLARAIKTAGAGRTGPPSRALGSFFSGERVRPGASAVAADAAGFDSGGRRPGPLNRFLVTLFGSQNHRELKGLGPVVDRVNALEPAMRALNDDALRAKTPEFKARLAAGETLDDILPEAFAAMREASRRVLKLRHRDVQIIGAVALHRGMIAEMATGEGKTLVAPLAVYLNALAGEGVHLFTVNDYLAKRDSRWMGAIYGFMGLSVGLLQNGMGISERKAAYAADVTYGTASEFGFDYLRDNMSRNPDGIVQRGHAYAIVDEVDSVMIDQARTPLIIAGGEGKGDEAAWTLVDRAAQGMRVRVLSKADRASGLTAEELGEGYDAVADEKDLVVTLTERGYDRAAELIGVPDIYTGDNAVWMHYLNQALKARHLFQKDVHYIVKDGEAAIVDEYTGRVMEGRQWSEGLQQAIQAKEGLRVDPETRTLASVTPQNFARLYRKLAGMTGTASPSAAEFAKIYELGVLTVPTFKPVIRRDLPDRIYRTHREKIEAAAREIARLHAEGRPVLAGTLSPERSAELSAALGALGVPHEVLDAKHHEAEADIVAAAGRLGAVTIATNMAGRGTDILLGGDPHHLARRRLAGRPDSPHEARHGGAPPRQAGRPHSPHEARHGGAPPRQAEGAAPDGAPSEDIVQAREEVADMVRYGRLESGIDREAYAKHLAAARAVTEAEKARVIAAGGLAVIGTERHDSRRIDLQLMGRAGRQGDPGSTQFFLSLEDKLMRLFGSDRVAAMMAALNWPEGEPLEGRMLHGTVEKSQEKVEARDFDARSHVIKYDDVLDHQRRAIYAMRRGIITGARPSERSRTAPSPRNNSWILREGDTREVIRVMFKESLDALVEKHLDARRGKWDLPGLVEAFFRRFGVMIPYDEDDVRGMREGEFEEKLREQMLLAYGLVESALTPEALRAIEKRVLLATIDDAWKDQLESLDGLKRFIYLRGYAQLDPLVEYKKDGFAMFEEMLSDIRDRSVDLLFNARLWVKEALSEIEAYPEQTPHGGVIER